jgi:hypothetical protein
MHDCGARQARAEPAARSYIASYGLHDTSRLLGRAPAAGAGGAGGVVEGFQPACAVQDTAPLRSSWRSPVWSTPAGGPRPPAGAE